MKCFGHCFFVGEKNGFGFLLYYSVAILPNLLKLKILGIRPLKP